MKRFELPPSVQSALKRAVEQASAFADEHRLAVGIVEMAAGAALLSSGVATGRLVIGTHLLATKLPALGGAGLAGVAATAASVVGSIGVTAMGGAFGVPAIVLLGGAAAVGGLMGYNMGQFGGHLLEPSWADYLESAGLALLGVALLVDGARRVLGSKQVVRAQAALVDGALKLYSVTKLVVAKTWSELQDIAQKLAPEDANDAAGRLTISGLAAGAGAAAGAAVAASSVTIMGSSALGSAALALGLVSAPLWPAIAGAAAAGTAGYALWIAVRNFGRERPLAEYRVSTLPAPALPRLPAPDDLPRLPAP